MASLLLLTLCAAASAGASPQAQSHLGDYIGTVDALARPVAATFGRAGDEPNALWIAEAGTAATPAGLRALGGIDASFQGTRAGRTVARAGVGVLQRPTGVAVDGAGNVYATDDVQHAVWRFALDGTHTKLAARGTALGSVLFPTDVEVWPRDVGTGTHLCVADAGNGRTQVLDLATGQWTELHAEDGPSEPLAVAFVPQRSNSAGATDASGAAGTPPPAGIIVADGARHQMDLFQLDGTYESSFSNLGYFPSLVASPAGIACADGLFFIADTDNHRVQAFDGERPADATDGLRYRFGIHAIRPGEGSGSLHYPSDIAIDGDAVVLAIVEPLDDRIQLFGRAQGATPKHDPTRVGLGAPSAHLGELISASGQYLTTLSPESHWAAVHDLRGDEPVKISAVFGFGGRLGMVRRPVGVAMIDEGRGLLVTDRGNRRLTRARLKVAPAKPIVQDAELETVLDGLSLGHLGIVPGDVAVVTIPTAEGSSDLPEQVIAVVDCATDTVVLFDDELALLRRVGALKNDAIAGIAGVATTPEGTLLVLDGFGATAPTTGDRAGIPTGRVHEFDLQGQLLGTFGATTLVNPAAAVCHGSRVWITDAARDRIEIFTRSATSGRYEHTGGFGKSGLGRAQFHEPRGLAITADERLIVLDHGNHRGQMFSLDGNFLGGFGGRLYTAPLRAVGGRTR